MDLQEIVRRLRMNQSIKTIKRDTGRHRSVIRRVRELAEQDTCGTAAAILGCNWPVADHQRAPDAAVAPDRRQRAGFRLRTSSRLSTCMASSPIATA